MADDWQVGDLALRVRMSGGDANPPVWTIPIGAVVTVAEVVVSLDALIELNFAEDPNPSDWEKWCFAGEDFTKITPEEADDFDRETIELMNRKTVGETVA